MLTEEDAKLYREQLHPAYGGYLHDGEITDRDVLATLFHLMKTGCIMPEFEDHDMKKKIVGLKKLNKKAYYDFEDLVLKALFTTSPEIPTKTVTELIHSRVIHKILLANIHSISKFPLINKNLRFLLGKYGEAHFTINGKSVNSIELANQFKTTHLKIIFPVFLGVGLFLFALSFAIPGDFGNKMALLLTGFFLIMVPALMYAMFIYSQKMITYGFESNILPYAKERYDELYEFLTASPLSNRHYTNEFLPYSVAFGIDTSWHQDFGLMEEITAQIHS